MFRKCSVGLFYFIYMYSTFYPRTVRSRAKNVLKRFCKCSCLMCNHDPIQDGPKSDTLLLFEFPFSFDAL